MLKFLLKLKNAVTGTPDTVELDDTAEVEIDGGQKISLSTLVNSFKAEQAEKDKLALENSAKEFKDDTLVVVDGKEVSVKDLKAAHAARILKNTADEEQKKKHEEEEIEAEKKKKDAEALKNAEDEKKKKEDDEKAEKEAEALKNSLAETAKAEAEKKAASEKAAKEKEFLDLKNAAGKNDPAVKLPAYESQDERLARGHKLFGQEPAASAAK